MKVWSTARFTIPLPSSHRFPLGKYAMVRLGVLARGHVQEHDIAEPERDLDVFTFSIHGARNFPFRKACSSLDIALEDRTGDGVYLDLLHRHLENVLDSVKPDLVFYLAGADPYGGDRLGRLALSIDGLERRDRAVFQACRVRGLPLAMVLAGGNAADLSHLVTIHANSVAALRRAYA